jgi:hypothetical protein
MNFLGSVTTFGTGTFQRLAETFIFHFHAHLSKHQIKLWEELLILGFSCDLHQNPHNLIPVDFLSVLLWKAFTQAIEFVEDTLKFLLF